MAAKRGLGGEYAAAMTLLTTELTATRDGLTQLQRRWIPDPVRAVLVLVHGIGEHSGRYGSFGEQLSEAGIAVLAADNRGFGQSGGRRAHVDRFDQFLDDIEDRLRDARVLGAPVILMGHSLGGLMVTSYLISDRPQPDCAVLSAPALMAQVPRWQRVLAPLLARVAPRRFVPTKIRPELLSRDVAVQEAYVADPLLVAGATAGFGHAVFRQMPLAIAGLDRISVPTYVLHGNADALVPLAASAPLEGHPLVTRRIWPGLRHECLNEPEAPEVIAAVLEWIDHQLAALSTEP